MYTAIVYLSLIWACGFTATAIGDQAELISARNLAAIRAEQTADAYAASCATGVCDNSVFTTAADDTPGTQINACLTGAALFIDVSIPVKPRLWIANKTGTARIAEVLNEGAAANLPACTT
ncbi:MAG: hypothetical protein F4124_01005 [Acidimicrobiia bacterium]|nr:hypothetical protein [Acidimicrobiia bacterium]MYB72361.1 hypothetical protein [Acidimicrobiia bacterium]MYH97996.1 hypothetical protein [Acidimicrobiia bacterium]